jgi:hypothetical protein
MLDLNSIRQRGSAGESFEYLFFWGHQPAKDGTITKSCLAPNSLAFEAIVIDSDVRFPCSHFRLS